MTMPFRRHHSSYPVSRRSSRRRRWLAWRSALNEQCAVETVQTDDIALAAAAGALGFDRLLTALPRIAEVINGFQSPAVQSEVLAALLRALNLDDAPDGVRIESLLRAAAPTDDRFQRHPPLPAVPDRGSSIEHTSS